MTIARVVLVRHAQPSGSWGQDPDPGLDPLGYGQARAVADILAPLGPLPLVTSPLRRTRETAAPLAEHWGVVPIIEAGVGELAAPPDPSPDHALWLQTLMAGRGTDAPARVAAKKSPGYAKLFETGKFKTHLPGAKHMRVLAVCPNAAFRDALRREVLRQNTSKKVQRLWRFVAQEDVSVDTMLHSPGVYRCEGGPVPLVKAAPVGAPMAELVEE